MSESDGGVFRSPSTGRLSEVLLQPKLVAEAKKKMGLLQFIPIVYFLSSGGPYGTEVAIAAGYPFFFLLMATIVPFFWSVPLGLTTAELGMAMPDNDGFIRWVLEAWGPAISFMVSVSCWLNDVIDNAIYPVLLRDYIIQLIKPLPFYAGVSSWAPQAVCYSAVALVMMLNLVGVDVVGTFSLLFTLIMLSPFVVMLVWVLATGDVHPNDWLETPPGDDFTGSGLVNLSLCLNLVLWCNSGYEATGNIVEELREPKKNLLKVLMITISAGVTTNLICIMGAVGIDNNYGEWVAGTYTDLARKLGGHGLAGFMTLGAVVSLLATFNACVCSSSQVFAALGDEHILNIRFLEWRHPRFGTPMIAVLIECAVVAALTNFPFTELVVVDNVLYCFELCLIFAAIVRLRFTQPDLERPFRLFKSNAALAVYMACPISICGFIIASALTSPSDYLKCGLALGLNIGLLGFYFARNYARRKFGFVARNKKVGTDEISPLLGSAAGKSSINARQDSFSTFATDYPEALPVARLLQF